MPYDGGDAEDEARAQKPDAEEAQLRYQKVVRARPQLAANIWHQPETERGYAEGGRGLRKD